MFTPLNWPHVDTFLSLDVGNQVRVSFDGPRAQAGHIEFVTVTGKPGGGVTRDVPVGHI